jgi:hypothetical protein
MRCEIFFFFISMLLNLKLATTEDNHVGGTGCGRKQKQQSSLIPLHGVDYMDQTMS